jgi:TP53 regulating kinase-like protein
LIFHGEKKLIYRGAEAEIYRIKWCEIDAVMKVRNMLPYRNKLLDRQIRAQRTIREAGAMAKVKEAGVRSPFIFYLDPRNASIVMEFIKGERLKDVLKQRDKNVFKLCRELGKILGRMHNINLIHGDMTTSNVIVNKEKLAVLDFGLSYFSTRVEDKATDLRLIKEVMSSAHSEIYPKCFDSFIDGYEFVVGSKNGRDVRLQLLSIERRGRYVSFE